MLWRVLILALMRFAPIVSMAPFLGAKIIPGVARMAIAFSLILMFLPTILLHMHTLAMPEGTFVFLVFKELLIGYFLGFLSAVPFYVAQSAGIVIDYMRGSSMLMAQDPTVQVQVSTIGLMFNFYLIALFYAVDGPLFFFNAIETSFRVFPVDTFLSPEFFKMTNPLWKLALGVIGHVFRISLQLAAPCLVAILMAEAFLGIANRLAPQVQIAFLGMSLKSLLGLTLLWTSWYIILRQMSSDSLHWVQLIDQILLQFPTSK